MPQSPDLATLLSRTAAAHHQAFISTDGADPDWPMWYAGYLLDNGLNQYVAADVAAPALAGLLIEADSRQRSGEPQQAWETFYSAFLVAQLGERK